jgi:hypothetical protein
MPSTMKSLPGNSWSPYIWIAQSIENATCDAKQSPLAPMGGGDDVS